MFLTTGNLVHYLIARGTIGPEAVVEGTLRIVDFSRRNRNFKVFLGEASGLFVKQITTIGSATYGGLTREVASHRLGLADPASAPLLDLMPTLVDHDPARNAITVGLVHPGEDLDERQSRLGLLSNSLARSFGQALGRLHGLPGTSTALEPWSFPQQRPWIFDAIRNAETLFPVLSIAQRDLINALRQTPEMVYGLGALSMAWRPETLIHGDLKRSNIMALIPPDGDETDQDGPTLKFIDWELADIGDPCWDVAGLFTTLLEPWLRLSPEAGPIANARPTIAAAWQSYATTLGLPTDVAAANRQRCVHYLGAKFLLLAMELLRDRSEPTPTTSYLWALARSIMIDPSQAASDLLGFDRGFETLESTPASPQGRSDL